MSNFIIQGGKPLHGEIWAEANKNAVLPILTATLLTDQKCIIKNVPKIRDVEYMLTILASVGSTYRYLDDSTLEIQTKNITGSDLPHEQVRKIRASVLLMGPMLARNGSVKMIHPGGDIIGKRSIDTHISAFEQLGVKVIPCATMFSLQAHHLQPATIFLDEVSVTATENVLLLCSLISGTTTIANAASEPHVQELCEVLVKMGARISGIGTNQLAIAGVTKLAGFEHAIAPDHIAVGTWAILAGVTRGDMTIHNVVPQHLDMILLVLQRFGLDCTVSKTEGLYHTLRVKPGKLKAIPKLDAQPWSGFPTDLISIAIVLATQAEGTTLVRDFMYEGRMYFTDKLITMGANIILCDPHRVVVSGSNQLYGRDLASPDIRAGMALVIAALVAEGESTISQVELIERGYADIEARLTACGAAITRT